MGRGALELGDSRLFEDCSKRGGALVSDVVGLETASEGWRGDGERVSITTGADRKANTLDAAAHSRSVIIVSLRTAARAEAPSSPMLLNPRLQVMGGGSESRRMSTGL